MKADATTRLYKKVYGIEESHADVNKHVKAIIVEYASGTVVVKNDNFGTRRKYADFTNGKKEAGLRPLDIVFSGVELAHILHDKYINEKDEVCFF